MKFELLNRRLEAQFTCGVHGILQVAILFFI